mgnify:CR=1 FL=1|jgi:hypothetical protein
MPGKQPAFSSSHHSSHSSNYCSNSGRGSSTYPVADTSRQHLQWKQ